MLDQHVIETVDDCYFMIVGNIHPPGRYAGLLTYIPSKPWHSRNDISRKTIGRREYTKISRAWFGRREDYMRHLKGYEHYLYEDKFFGTVTSVPDCYIRRIIHPAPVRGIAAEACEMLGLPQESAVLVGSSLLQCEPEDIDVGIVGKDAVALTAARLEQLTSSPEHQVHHDYFGCAHQKQFMCGGRKIDLFPLYSESDALPDFSYTTDVGERLFVEDIVTDASHGAFRPSFYQLAGGPLVTYQIEHMMVLRNGDAVRTHAWRTPNGFLVRMGDPYEDITPWHRFVGERNDNRLELRVS